MKSIGKERLQVTALVYLCINKHSQNLRLVEISTLLECVMMCRLDKRRDGNGA